MGTCGHNGTFAVPGKLYVHYGSAYYCNFTTFTKPNLTNLASPSLALPGALTQDLSEAILPQPLTQITFKIKLAAG